MDWLQFIAATIRHLAWPVVVLITVFSVRPHLGSLAERVLELSFGGATLKFDKLLSKGAELVEESPLEIPDSSDKHGELPSLSASDGMPDPTSIGTILLESDLAFHQAFELLMECAEQMKVKTRSPGEILRMLTRRGLISREIVELYETLDEARFAALRAGRAERSFALTKGEAAELLRQNNHLKLTLMQALQNLKSRTTVVPIKQ